MWKASLKDGCVTGVKTTWTLGKIIFPVTMAVVLLQHTPVLPWVIDLLAPFMHLFGLSGDAAIPLVLGNFLNLYAGIAGVLSLDLTVKEVFIIAMMLSFSHNLLIESSVAIKVGVKIWVMMAVRVGLAILSAIVINLFWSGEQEFAKYGMIAPETEEVTGIWAILLQGFEKASLGVFQVAIIVIPIMIVIQFLKDFQWIDVFSRIVSPFTRALGMKENTSMTLAAGLLFGLAYGAGVMIQAVEEDGVSKKDVTLAFIFLVACHAVIEDTLIFLPLGINVLPLLLIRLTVAILLTIAVSFVWKQAELNKERKAA